MLDPDLVSLIHFHPIEAQQQFSIYKEPKFVFSLKGNHLYFAFKRRSLSTQSREKRSYTAAPVITSIHSLNLEMGNSRLAAGGMQSFQGN